MSSEDNKGNEAQPSAWSASAYNDWTKKVADSLIEAERKWLELATQQNELALKALRQGMEFYRSAPDSNMADWVRQGVESMMESQKRWAESVSRQTNSAFEAQASGTEAVTPDPATYGQQQANSLVEARKRWLDFAARQNAQFNKSMQAGLGLSNSQPANTLAEWNQQAVNNYVEVQKRWLDLYSSFTFPGMGRPNKK